MQAFVLLILACFVQGVVSSEYARLCDSVFCKIISKSQETIQTLKKQVDEDGMCVPQFGSKADEICNIAIEEFSAEAPLPDDSKDLEILYDKKIEELERVLDAPLHVLYLKQLSILKERALKVFKQSLASSDKTTEFEAMMLADEQFRREALELTRGNVEWSFTKEASLLKSALLEVANKAKKLQEVSQTSVKQGQQVMDFIRTHQQQMQALQQQLSSGGSPWQMAVAYRIPDTNVNIQCAYQQGRGNVQISCVPDESMSLLGPNGFVHGVTPGNVGVSFNINI